MRIAISTEGNGVSPHFGRCSEFTIVDIEDGTLKGKEVLENPGHEPGKLPRFLRDHNVDRIVAGGMGRRAQMFFEEMGISWIIGVTGTVENTIQSLIDGTLEAGESLCTSSGEGDGHGSGDHECRH